MPKLGMEPIRRAALVDATIAEVGAHGTLDVTVAKIARRAGVSSALAHHYFGGKSDLFTAAMRSILSRYGTGVRAGLKRATGPRARLDAILSASFAPDNFRHDVVAAWMTFYVQAQVSPPVRRLLSVYHRRLRANLLHELRPLTGDRAPLIAETIAALIDGIYIRAALSDQDTDAADALHLTRDTLNMLLETK